MSPQWVIDSCAQDEKLDEASYKIVTETAPKVPAVHNEVCVLSIIMYAYTDL